MQRVYAPGDADRRKLKFLYRQGGIDTRYSVIPDYSLPAGSWEFYMPTEDLEPFPALETRMQWFKREAAPLSLVAIRDCLKDFPGKEITHLITVSCTGMSAPGLDLELVQALGLPHHITRMSVNFMGCYAALHALKIADAFCKTEENANVLIVCTELCTLHFQKEHTTDNITSSMLFADGSAAALVSNDPEVPGLQLGKFNSTIASTGNSDMAWHLSSSGFRMTLSSYIADLVEENFRHFVDETLQSSGMSINEITQWCIHPGGKKILEAVQKSLEFSNGQLDPCYHILKNYGNMSSPTVLFVLREMMRKMPFDGRQKTFMAAFGPGLTMETLILSS